MVSSVNGVAVVAVVDVVSVAADVVEEPVPADSLLDESLEHPPSTDNVTRPDMAAARALVIFFELFGITAILARLGDTRCVG